MKHILHSSLIGLSIFLLVFGLPKILLFFGLSLGGVGYIILLIVVSLIVGTVFVKGCKGMLTDLDGALSSVVYSILYIILSNLYLDTSNGVVTITDKVLLAAGASLLIFISLSVVGKILNPKSRQNEDII